MRSFLWIVFLFALWPAALGAAEGDRLKELGFLVQEGFEEAPVFATEDASGNRVESGSFRGRLVVLNFWATWCPPCRREMPSMERLYREFRGKGLEVVAMNFMETAEQVKAFAEEQKLSYPMLLDRQADIAERYGVMRLPETVLIGRKGEVIAKAVGYKDWYKDDVRELVAALLGEAKSADVAVAADPPVEPARATAPQQGAWTFPDIDPVAFGIGPLVVRWYGLMYLFGFVGGFFVARWMARRRGLALGNEQLRDLVTYVAVGVVLGGRLGYALFYNLSYFLADPLQIFAFWHGGMSFHGGLLGAALAGWGYLRKHGLPFYPAADCIFAAAPLGLGLGRLGNFINGELYGRPTDVAWGMVFPDGGPLPRHPSQLYEAFLEGAVLLAVLMWLGARVRADGVVTWAFVGGYGVVRFMVEFFREPDAHLGLVWGLSRGQYLSVAMIAAAAVFFWARLRRPAAPVR